MIKKNNYINLETLFFLLPGRAHIVKKKLHKNSSQQKHNDRLEIKKKQLVNTLQF